MKTYIISSEVARHEMVRNFKNETAARHWVIAHCDLSQNWTIEESKIPFII